MRALILSLMILTMVGITACQSNPHEAIWSNINNSNSQSSGGIVELEEKISGTLKIHYIDVGQGDSILIQCGNENMVIDAGSNNKGELVKEYLKSQGVEELEYVIATHPHEDHVGGLDIVIDNYNIDKVIMPKITTTTRTYKDVINSIRNKNLKITVPKVGTSFSLGEASFVILAPSSSEYEDANNYSVCIKLTYGNNSFLFTGDAEEISEEEMISSGINLRADVLKLGHHGSRYSTTEEFLAAVNPRYTVISVGKNNDYGHPHSEVMNRLDNLDIPVYRTDKNQTVIATSDGDKITFNCDSGSYLPGNDYMNKDADSDNKKPGYDNSIDSTDGIEIANIDKVNEIVTIKNTSNKDVNLNGWTLVSVTGNQKYVFEDYVIKVADSITVASGKAEGDIKWCKAYIWNNESEDEGQLLNESGALVSSY